MHARIKEKREVAKQTLLVTFDLLGPEIDFEPGQYSFVTLPDIGHQDERGLRRLRETAFQRTLAELEVGAEVEVEEPKGDFVLPKQTDEPYVFIAGGIGIPVFRSMLRYIAEERLPHRVTLIYSNRDQESTAFRDELAEFEGANPNLRVVCLDAPCGSSRVKLQSSGF